MTAFVLRQNGLWSDTTQLNESNAAGVKIPRGAFLTPVATPQQVEAPNGSGGQWLGHLDSCVVIIFSSDVRPQKIPKYDYNLEGGLMKSHFINGLIALLILALTLPACAPQVTDVPIISGTPETPAPTPLPGHARLLLRVH